MKNLKKNSTNNLANKIEKDQNNGEYFFSSRDSKYRRDIEDRLFEINKNVRFKEDPIEKQHTRYCRRGENPFKFFA